MLNRRHLRIKVLQLLYAYQQNKEGGVDKVNKELLGSIERMYDMYFYLILTFSGLRKAANRKIEEGKKKLVPTESDLNPNLKFVENKIIKSLDESLKLRQVCEKRKVNWLGDENQLLIRKMLSAVLESEVYTSYFLEESNGFEEDKMFAVNLFKEQIANSDVLYSFFEEKSIYWMDDLDLCCSMVIKSLKSIEENQEFEILPLYKDEIDETQFIQDLIKYTIEKESELEELIASLAENWDMDRIAKMDMLLLKMGIVELQYFPSIPTKVTINEYIEISKFYSTPKSNIFINGILDRTVLKLKKENKINKSGRGLIE